MLKIKKIVPYTILIFFILLVSCGGFKEAGKVLRNEKTNSTDEFLVKKRDPLILPPDYEVVPEPNSKENKANEDDENKVKKIIKKKAEDEKSSDKSASSTENSILRNIRK